MNRTTHASSIFLLTAIGLFWMALYIYIPILSPYVVHLGGSMTLVGLVVAAYGVPQLLLRIGLGTWSDRLGRRKPFIFAGFGLILVSSLGMWLWPTPVAFIFWRLLAGLAASCWAMFSVLYLVHAPPRRAVSALGWVSFANAGGQVVASVLGGVLAERFGWSGPFWGSLILAAMGLAAMAGVREASVETAPAAPRERSWTLLRGENQLANASVLGIFFQIGTFVTTFGFIPVLGYQMGLSKSNLGLLLMVSLIPTTLASVATGSLFARRFSLKRLVMTGFLIMCAMTALTPAIRTAGLLFLISALLGIGRGMLAPTLTMLSITGVADRAKATAMATYQASYALGMIGGPALAGWAVAQWGLSAAFWLAAAAGGGGVVLAWNAGGWVHALIRRQPAPAPK